MKITAAILFQKRGQIYFLVFVEKKGQIYFLVNGRP